jgi:hypothetical protein
MIIKAQSSDGAFEDCEIEVANRPPWKLVFSGCGLVRKEFASGDLFAALVALRQELEASGFCLLCQGARKDVYPSGMSRSMSGGRKAYILRIGSPSKASDLVNIFDDAEHDQIGTVHEQNAYHKLWIDHIMNQLPASEPLPGEVAEAEKHPNGWVYRVAGSFSSEETIPPESNRRSMEGRCEW